MVVRNSYPTDNDWNRLDPKLRQQTFLRIAGRVSKNDTEDFIQNVVETAYRNRFSFNKPRILDPIEKVDDLFLAWTSGIVRYKLIEYFEKEKKHKELVQNYTEEISRGKDLAFADAGFFSLERHELAYELTEILAHLDFNTVQALVQQMEGKSVKEIAEMFAWTESQTSKRLSRFKEKLRERIDSMSLEKEFIFKAKINLVDVFKESIQKRTIEECRYEAENSFRKFNELFSHITYVDSEVKDALLSARGMIDEVGMKIEDKIFVTDEINLIANEMLTGNPNMAIVEKHIRFIRFNAPQIATVLAGICCEKD